MLIFTNDEDGFNFRDNPVFFARMAKRFPANQEEPRIVFNIHAFGGDSMTINFTKGEFEDFVSRCREMIIEE